MAVARSLTKAESDELTQRSKQPKRLAKSVEATLDLTLQGGGLLGLASPARPQGRGKTSVEDAADSEAGLTGALGQDFRLGNEAITALASEEGALAWGASDFLEIAQSGSSSPSLACISTR